MLIVDTSCLFEVLVGTPRAETIRQHLADDTDHAAQHVVDVEVLSVIRREHRRGELDSTSARQAVEDLRDWSGERFPHPGLLERAWELRATVCGWDAMYVALAEAMGATLVTTDQRLSRVGGLRCTVELIG